MNEKKKGIIVLAVLLLFVVLVVALIIIDNVNSKKELDKFMKYYNSQETTLVMLGKEGCSYCEAFQPELDFMAEQYNFKYEYIAMDKLNSSDYKKLLDIIEVSSSDFGTPYTVVVENGKKIDSLAGAVEESELLDFLKKYNFVGKDAKLLINYIDYNKYDELLKSSTKQIIGIGKTTCIYSKMSKPVLNRIIKQYGITINYLNLDSLKEEQLNSLYNSLEFFTTEEWGTPTFLIVENGKLVDYISGLQTDSKFVSIFKEYGLIGD